MTVQGMVHCGSTKIPYEIVYSPRRKTIALSVHPSKRVTVTAPQNMEKGAIRSLVQKKVPWIMKKFSWFDMIPHRIIEREYVNGETFLYLGRQYQLKIITGAKKSDVKLIGRFLEISIPSRYNGPDLKNHIKRKIRRWYAQHARQKIELKIREFCQRINILTPEFQIKNLKKRWGSCTEKNLLTINTRILMAPISQLEYVIMHELCHVTCKNHSLKYWEKLRLAMPDYEIRRENLKRDGWGYVL